MYYTHSSRVHVCRTCTVVTHQRVVIEHFDDHLRRVGADVIAVSVDGHRLEDESLVPGRTHGLHHLLSLLTLVDERDASERV